MGLCASGLVLQKFRCDHAPWSMTSGMLSLCCSVCAVQSILALQRKPCNKVLKHCRHPRSCEISTQSAPSPCLLLLHRGLHDRACFAVTGLATFSKVLMIHEVLLASGIQLQRTQCVCYKPFIQICSYVPVLQTLVSSEQQQEQMLLAAWY